MSGINPGAYQGELTCPWIVDDKGNRSLIAGERVCGSKALRYVEHVTPTRIRYRCRKCGGTLQYDISNRNDLNPYAPYRKGRIWSAIEKVLGGGSLKGAMK